MTEENYDPYPERPEGGMNLSIIATVVNSEIESGKNIEGIKESLTLLIDGIGRTPGIDGEVVKSLQRDMADILELSECVGTEKMVLSRMGELAFECGVLAVNKEQPIPGLSLGGATYKGDCIHFVPVCDKDKKRIREKPLCNLFPRHAKMAEKGCGKNCKDHVKEEEMK